MTLLKRHTEFQIQCTVAATIEVAQMNMRLALERRAETERLMPAMRLVVGR